MTGDSPVVWVWRRDANWSLFPFYLGLRICLNMTTETSITAGWEEGWEYREEEAGEEDDDAAAAAAFRKTDGRTGGQTDKTCTCGGRKVKSKVEHQALVWEFRWNGFPHLKYTTFAIGLLQQKLVSNFKYQDIFHMKLLL